MAKRGGKRAPTLAKAKKMVTKNHKAKAKKNMDTYFLKTKTLVNVVPTQGVTVGNYVYAQFTMDPTGTNANQFISNAEFQLWRLQYDKFRVNSVKITVTPKSNVFDVANNNNDAINTIGDGVVHTCIDRDGIAPSSKALISRYPSYRKYSVMKPFSRSYSIKYPTGVWVDCETPGAFTMAKELGLTGGITLYADNLVEDNFEIFNEPWAQIVVEYNIVFQGKTSNSLSGVYDASGNVIGVTINAIQSSDLLEPSPLKSVSGTLDLDTVPLEGDLSGNDVKVNDLGVPLA